MPIYEYECSACGKRHEVFQNLSDPSLKNCPACQQSALTKLVSATNFQLKGTGWYATDFRNKEPGVKKEGAPDTAKEPSKETSSSSTTDSTAA